MDAIAARTARQPVARRHGLARRWLVGWLIGAAVLGPGASAAPAASAPAAAEAPGRASSAVPAETSEEVESATADLVVNSRTVFTFRAPLLGVSPAERARRARLRIQEQLRSGGALEVTVEVTPMGQVVMIDDVASFGVLPADVDPVKRQKPAAAAKEAAQALRLVIDETRESRNVGALVRGLIAATLATLVLAALLWFMRRVERRLVAWGVMFAQRRSPLDALGQAGRLIGERIGPVIRWLSHLMQALLVAVLVYAWLVFVMRQFALTRAWSERLHLFLFGTLGDIGSAVVDALPGMFTVLVIFLLARYAVRGLDQLFERVRNGQLVLGWLDPELARPTRRIAGSAIWLFALAMAYPYLPGANTDAFKGVSVLVGVMISLGASNLVGQAASGLILTYSRIIRRGEYVRVADHEGTVVDLGMFTTRVRTGMGEELTLPNSLILGNVTKNYSRTVKGPGFIVDTTVTIGYDTAWRQVRAMLIEAALRTPGVLNDPAPHVFQTALSDYYPEYRLVCQAVPAEPRPRAEVLNQLHASIQDVFAENGVQIMSPNYRGDPTEPKVPPLPAPGAAS